MIDSGISGIRWIKRFWWLATGSMYSTQLIKSLCYLWLILEVSLSPHTPSFPVLTPTQPIFTESLGHMRENKITKLCSAHSTVWMESSEQLWLESLLIRCLFLSVANLSSSLPLPGFLLSFPSPFSFFPEVLPIQNHLGKKLSFHI